MKKESYRERLRALALAVRWTYRSSKALTFVAFISILVGGLLTIVEPYIFKLIIDKIVGSGDYNLAEKFGIGLVGILVIYGIARILQGFFWDVQIIFKRIHSQKLDKYAAQAMMNKVSSLDAVYFENPEYYNTLQKANQSLWRVNEFFWQFTFLLGQFISVVVIVAALFTFSWKVVLLVVLAAVPSILLTFRAVNLVWSAFDVSSPIFRQANYYRSLMTDNPQAVKEIRLFGLKPHFLNKFGNLISNFIRTQEKAAKKELGLYILIGIVEGILSVFAAWLVVRAFTNGEISIGELTFYWTLLFQFAGNARYMVRAIGELNSSAKFISPLVKIFDYEPTVKEKENPRGFPLRLKKGIEFKNVTFFYPRAKTPALKNFNLIIKPGESIALVGENGSGKTTIVKLLTRMYDVSSGEILIDGVNVKEYSLDSLHENLGVIFQDFMKYEALVEENIGYGKLGDLKKSEKIHEASVNAEAWDFIRDLNKKYKTHVGKTLEEEGTELSVGQWQKIALARAFFKDAQILCLDEPTAAVDAKSEYRLFKRFEDLTKNKTTILISHRFSTVRMAHKIAVIDKGRLIEQGSHRELIRKNGRYAKLFRMQAEGYLDI